MSKNTTHTKHSALSKLNLGFEYDITWAQAKKPSKNALFNESHPTINTTPNWGGIVLPTPPT